MPHVTPAPAEVGRRAADILTLIKNTEEYARLERSSQSYSDCWATFTGYPLVAEWNQAADAAPLFEEALRAIEPHRTCQPASPVSWPPQPRRPTMPRRRTAGPCPSADPSRGYRRSPARVDSYVPTAPRMRPDLCDTPSAVFGPDNEDPRVFAALQRHPALLPPHRLG